MAWDEVVDYAEFIIEVKHGRLFSKVFGEEVTKVTLLVEDDWKKHVDSYLNGHMNEEPRG